MILNERGLDVFIHWESFAALNICELLLVVKLHRNLQTPLENTARNSL